MTYNQFTSDELHNTDYSDLVREAIAISLPEFSLEDLTNKIKPISFQSSTYLHPHTKIEVSQRFQYTPSQLSRLLQAAGFKTTDLKGCNMHFPPLTSGLKNMVPPDASFDAIPYCSTFMIAAIK